MIGNALGRHRWSSAQNLESFGLHKAPAGKCDQMAKLEWLRFGSRMLQVHKELDLSIVGFPLYLSGSSFPPRTTLNSLMASDLVYLVITLVTFTTQTCRPAARSGWVD
jgi:hypothetical protein